MVNEYYSLRYLYFIHVAQFPICAIYLWIYRETYSLIAKPAFGLSYKQATRLQNSFQLTILRFVWHVYFVSLKWA